MDPSCFGGGTGGLDGNSVGAGTTQWEDQLVKHKIKQRRKKPVRQDIIHTKEMWEEKEKDHLADKTLAELEEMEDELDEDVLEARRNEIRKKQLQEKAARERFGRIRQISKDEYTSEVSEASKDCWVVCCLFVSGQPESEVLLRCLGELAGKFRGTKFVKIIAQECIKDYRMQYCPTMIIYNKGDLARHIKGINQFCGLRMTADVLEWHFAKTLGMFETELEYDPTLDVRRININKISAQTVQDDDDDSSDLDL